MDKILKKGTEESWQMTMKSLIILPFEEAVHGRGLKTKIKLHYLEFN